MSRFEVDGIDALRVGELGRGCPAVVLLHGFAMTPEDLTPFTRIFGAGTAVFFPRGGVSVRPGTLHRPHETHTWWPVDTTARALAMARGPRDLSAVSPPGVDAARARLQRFVSWVRHTFEPSHLIVGGFSQGAMLALDWALEQGPELDALFLLSGARIRAAAWEPLWPRVAGKAIYQSHGVADPDLSFESALRLRDVLCEHGANVDWHAFTGGHETPLIVWRTLRRFIESVVAK